MQITSVTVGLPVRDLDAARKWYQRLLQLGPPELSPVDGVVEYELGPVWLQLFEAETELVDAAAAADAAVLRIGVPDVYAEHERLAALGLQVDPVIRVERVIDFLDLRDPDGHPLSFYAVHPDTVHPDTVHPGTVS